MEACLISDKQISSAIATIGECKCSDMTPNYPPTKAEPYLDNKLLQAQVLHGVPSATSAGKTVHSSCRFKVWNDNNFHCRGLTGGGELWKKGEYNIVSQGNFTKRSFTLVFLIFQYLPQLGQAPFAIGLARVLCIVERGVTRHPRVHRHVQYYTLL